MNRTELMHWLYQTPVVEFLRKSDHRVIEVVEIFHVLGLVLLLTGVLLINLRLLGAGLRRQSLPQVAQAAKPLIWTGLSLAILTGLTIFLSAVLNYNANSAFWPKMILLVLAVAVQFTLLKKVTATETPNPVLARGTAVLSLILWFSVGLMGRAIGFVA